MSTTSTVRNAALRIVFSGAFAVGLLVSGPATDARAVTVPTVPAAATPTKSTTTHHLTRAERRAKARAVARKHRAHRIHRAVGVATHQKGDPYVYGATGPNGFDCSGLTYYSFRKAGFRSIPRTSSAQSHWARHIKRSHLRRGDLIFFTHGSSVYHVGIYAGRRHGHRMVLHAPYSGTHVRTDAIWTNAWFPATLRHR